MQKQRSMMFESFLMVCRASVAGFSLSARILSMCAEFRLEVVGREVDTSSASGVGEKGKHASRQRDFCGYHTRPDITLR